MMAEAVSVLSSLKTRRSSSTPPPQVPQTAAQLEDEDLTFARYLAGEIRKVKTPRVKHGLRMKLKNAIFDAQQEDEESTRQLHPQSAVSSGGFLSEMQSDMNTHFHDMTSSGINTYQPTYTNM